MMVRGTKSMFGFFLSRLYRVMMCRMFISCRLYSWIRFTWISNIDDGSTTTPYCFSMYAANFILFSYIKHVTHLNSIEYLNTYVAITSYYELTQQHLPEIFSSQCHWCVLVSSYDLVFLCNMNIQLIAITGRQLAFSCKQIPTRSRSLQAERRSQAQTACSMYHYAPRLQLAMRGSKHKEPSQQLPRPQHHHPNLFHFAQHCNEAFVIHKFLQLPQLRQFRDKFVTNFLQQKNYRL